MTAVAPVALATMNWATGESGWGSTGGGVGALCQEQLTRPPSRISTPPAMAIGQFAWGAVQPIAGALADRYGPARVLFAGLVLLALGSAVFDRFEKFADTLHLPAQDLTYTAAKDGPARMNGAVIAPSDHGYEGATVLSGKPAFDPVHWRGSAPPLQRAFRPSLAWRLCLVAEGRFDATLSLRAAWEWLEAQPF